MGAAWPAVTVVPAPGVGSDLVTLTDAGVTTGLETVLVVQVEALPHPGVLTLVKLPWLEIVDALASLALTLTWKPRFSGPLSAATEVIVQVTVPEANDGVQLGVVPQVAEAAT